MSPLAQIPLEIAPPLESCDDPSAISLGLAGDHQRINAALAVALCQRWTQRAGPKAQVEALDQVRDRKLELTRLTRCFDPFNTLLRPADTSYEYGLQEVFGAS